MKKKSICWLYETRCHRCDEINVWVLNPDNNIILEKQIDTYKGIHLQIPFTIKYCNYCRMETRQEWVAVHSKGDKK